MEVKILGIVLGYSILNKQLVLFTHEISGNDYIYKITKPIDGYYEVEILLQGDLNFQLDSYFETLPVYENENIQKVYWVDGVNQPRFINIADKYLSTAEGINKINFIPLMNLNETVRITEQQSSGGGFPAGTVQYVMTYYNINGSQSNIFYTSELFYPSFNDRGAEPNAITSDVFNISISGVDSSFDYIRIYSIFRSTIDSTPIVKRVTDLKISDSNQTYTYTDNNSGGQIEDLSIILFAGGNSIIPKTIEQKDNVLFLGNYEFLQKPIDAALKHEIKGAHSIAGFASKVILTEASTGQYPYNNQLKYSSKEISFLKYLEYYRFGVQFQDNTGVWSDAVWLNDYRQEKKPVTNNPLNGNNNLNATVNDFILTLNSGIRQKLISNNWVKMRPLIVFPKPNEREVVAQGIVCPTIYNTEDRYTNSPFAQSSWFARPNIPFDLSYTRPRTLNNSGNEDTIISKAKSIIANEYTLRAFQYALPEYTESVRKSWSPSRWSDNSFSTMYTGAKWPEFRHDCPIPDSRYENSEIQLITTPEFPFISNDSDVSAFTSSNSDNFYIDQSIVTFHSPEIEFDNNVKGIDLSNCKFRIVGSAALTGTSTGFDLATDSLSQAEVITINNDFDIEYNKFGKQDYNVNIDNSSLNGFKGLLSMPYWIDRQFASTKPPSGMAQLLVESIPLRSFVTYPWNRSYSLTNQFTVKSNDELLISSIQAAVPKDKQVLNLRFAGYNEYFDINNIWQENNFSHYGVSDIEFFNSKENTGIRVKAPLNSGLDDFVYYGNIDKIVVPAEKKEYDSVYCGAQVGPDEEMELTRINWFLSDYRWGMESDASTMLKTDKLTDPVHIQYKSTPHAVIALNYSIDKKQTILPTHYHVNSAIANSDTYSAFRQLNNNKLKAVNKHAFQKPGTKRFWEKDTFYNPSGVSTVLKITYWGSEDPYEASRNAFEYSQYKWIDRPPSGEDRYWYNPETGSLREYLGGSRWSNASFLGILEYTDEYGVTRYFDRSNGQSWTPNSSVVQDALPLNHDFGYFWIGEIYNDNVQNRFGGTSDDALFQNEWLIAGDAVNISDGNLMYSRGDTYLQRYDHLKTYSGDASAINSVTDIVSFFCETHINIDGRYDRNRGNTNNLLITPELMNLFNPVYNQTDNLFSYHVIDSTRYNLNVFSNSITWTKTKLFGEEIDSWTNINVVDNIDLDGEKGPLRTITKFNNELFAFQDEGIANILYNSRTQISSTEYSNIVIGNSNKVDGKYYIAQFGTPNRGSVKSTPDGIYFIDGITNGIYVFDGQNIRCLSDELGFRDWVGDNVTNEEWTVNGFKNFVTHYDETTSDVYFVSRNYCLNYSEYLNQFVSFLSYENTPHMFNLDGLFYSILNDKNNNSYLYENFAGDYNMFYKNKDYIDYPTYQNFYTTVIANENPVLDKVFTNIDFKGDFFNPETNEYLPHTTYDTLEVWTEYQNGALSLRDDIDFRSPLKKKFNRWRANVPRDNRNTRDRIRNNWAFVKLSKNNTNTNRSELHELLVYHYS